MADKKNGRNSEVKAKCYQAMNLMKDGKSINEAIEITGVNVRTFRRFRKRLNLHVTDASILAKKASKLKSKIESQEQKKEPIAILEANIQDSNLRKAVQKQFNEEESVLDTVDEPIKDILDDAITATIHAIKISSKKLSKDLESLNTPADRIKAFAIASKGLDTLAGVSKKIFEIEALKLSLSDNKTEPLNITFKTVDGKKS